MQSPGAEYLLYHIDQGHKRGGLQRWMEVLKLGELLVTVEQANLGLHISPRLKQGMKM